MRGGLSSSYLVPEEKRKLDTMLDCVRLRRQTFFRNVRGQGDLGEGKKKGKGATGVLSGINVKASSGRSLQGKGEREGEEKKTKDPKKACFPPVPPR